MYWEQLELRCRSLYGQGTAAGLVGARAAGTCGCCNDCGGLGPWWAQSPGNLYTPNPDLTPARWVLSLFFWTWTFVKKWHNQRNVHCFSTLIFDGISSLGQNRHSLPTSATSYDRKILAKCLLYIRCQTLLQCLYFLFGIRLRRWVVLANQLLWNSLDIFKFVPLKMNWKSTLKTEKKYITTIHCANINVQCRSLYLYLTSSHNRIEKYPYITNFQPRYTQSHYSKSLFLTKYVYNNANNSLNLKRDILFSEFTELLLNNIVGGQLMDRSVLTNNPQQFLSFLSVLSFFKKILNYCKKYLCTSFFILILA